MIRFGFAIACATALGVAVTSMATTMPAVAQQPAPAAAPAAASDPETVVARVGDSEITAGDVAAAYQELPEQYRQLPINVLYKQLLEQLVNRQLMLDAGVAQNLGEDEDIQRQVTQFRNFVIQRTYLDRLLADVVSDDTLRDEYDATFGAEKGAEQVKASHILLQNEADANAVINELADGVDFAKLAREKSTGPSGPNGGDLGYFAREQMVAPFSEAAFDMEDGETSTEPVKTQFGWHVIKVTGRRTLPPPPFEEVRKQIEDQLTRAAVEAHMAELRAATTVELFNPDGSPAMPDGAK